MAKENVSGRNNSGNTAVFRNVFKDMSKIENGNYYISCPSDHFGFSWYVIAKRNENNLGLYLHCHNLELDEYLTIDVNFEIRLLPWDRDGITEKKSNTYSFTKNEGEGSHSFIEWEEMEKNYLKNDEITVEIQVERIKTTTWPILRKFNDPECSDMTLMMKDKKFYVSKLFLASQSSYFKRMLLREFAESKKSEIELHDIDECDLQKYLEALYAESNIDETSVEGILHIAEMYETPRLIQKCEDFLMYESRKPLKRKLELSVRYKLEELKKFCLAEIKTGDGIKSAIPSPIDDMYHTIMAILFERTLALMPSIAVIAIENVEKVSTESSENTFVLRDVFRDVSKMEQRLPYYSFAYDYFGLSWFIDAKRSENNLGLHLHCRNIELDEQWAINVNFEIRLLPWDRNGITEIKSSTHRFTHTDEEIGWDDFIEWEEMKKNYLKNDEITVEIQVERIKITLPILRKFDDPECSDVALIVKGKKFYVSKLYLAAQSSYFKGMFLREFAESKKSEVVLHDIDECDLQKYLEALYAESAIYEMSVEGILHIADMYETPLLIRKCEGFLIKESKNPLKRKLELSVRYKLEELKKFCLAKIVTGDNIKSAIPSDIYDMDPTLMTILFEKHLILYVEDRMPRQNQNK